MATGGRTTNTQSEMLVNMLRDISVTKTLPDADLEFLVNLETVILGKLREPLQQAAGQMGPGAAPPPDPGMGGGMPPGMAPPPGPMDQGAMMPPMMPSGPAMTDAPIPPPPGGGMPAVPGVGNSPAIPSGDELSRFLQSQPQ